MKLFKRHVTYAEAVKGRITVRERYRPMFENHFGPLQHEDDPEGGEEDFYKDFFREDTKERIRLKLCMRNKDRKEIRLYLRKKKKGQGYRIDGNSILLISFRGGKAHITSKPAGLKEPNRLYPRDKNQRLKRLPRPRDEEPTLNSALNGLPKLLTKKERQEWARSGELVKKCLQFARYKCEAGWKGTRFVSKATRHPYAEVHHLIPRKFQDQFRTSLDTLTNFCCLSPQAHRAIHHGTDEQVIQLLEQLLRKRPTLVDDFDICEDLLFRMYGLE